MRMFDEMLQREFAEKIYYAALTSKNNEKKNKNKQKNKKKKAKVEKTRKTANYDVLSALRYFDANGSGCLDKRSLEQMIHYTGHGISTSKLKDLLSCSKSSLNDESYEYLWKK